MPSVHPSVEQVTVMMSFPELKMSFPWDTDGAINRIGDKREKNQAGADRQNNMKRKPGGRGRQRRNRKGKRGGKRRYRKRKRQEGNYLR